MIDYVTKFVPIPMELGVHTLAFPKGGLILGVETSPSGRAARFVVLSQKDAGWVKKTFLQVTSSLDAASVQHSWPTAHRFGKVWSVVYEGISKHPKTAYLVEIR